MYVCVCMTSQSINVCPVLLTYSHTYVYYYTIHSLLLIIDSQETIVGFHIQSFVGFLFLRWPFIDTTPEMIMFVDIKFYVILGLFS